MSKLSANLIASLEGEKVPVRRVMVCYQSKKNLAQQIAGLLPYPSVIINSIATVLTENELAGVSHVIELYEPAEINYELCCAQRTAMRRKDCRILSLFDWQDSYLEDDFWGETNYQELAQQLDTIKQSLDSVHSFHVTSELGTDITFSVKGRRWIVANGLCRNDVLSQMPDGELYTCPVEESFAGVIVVDGTISRSWLPDQPQRLEFRQGKLINCSADFEHYIQHHGPAIYMIGEFALGFNPAHGRIIRNISVDEKAAGTVHFALGDSYNLGENTCQCHVDMVIRNPRIETTPGIILPYFQ